MQINRISFSNNFVLQNEKIGIGNTNPQVLLDIGGDTNIFGKVGIGKTLPEALLDVNGNVNISGITTTHQLNVSSNAFIDEDLNVFGNSYHTGIVSAYSFSGFGTDLVNLNASNLSFGTVPPERLTASSGNFIVGQDLHVNGNLSIAGTSAIINAETLVINDKNIIVGYTTDGNDNLVSNDNTANGGGISIASTVGFPIIDIFGDGILSSYKQISWFKQGSYSGMGTDAWVFNYPVSIGNTSTVLNQSRLTVGAGFTVFDTYLDASSIDIYTKGLNSSSGVFGGNVTPSANSLYNLGSFSNRWNTIFVDTITANTITGTLVGAASSLTITPDNLNSSRYLVLSSSVSGITSVLVDDGIVYNPSTNSLGIGTINPTQKLDVVGNISVSGLVTTKDIFATGVSTFANGPVLIGAATSTGTSLQRLQVTGGAYVSGSVGIGTTNPTSKLSVQGDANITGITTTTTLNIGADVGISTTRTGITTTAATTIDSFSTSVFRSARVQVQITQGSNYQASDILMIHDGSTADLIEYGSIATNDYLGSFTGTISAGNCLLRVTMNSATSATVKVLSQRITI